MNKKILFIFRIILYTFAAYILYDTFLADKTSPSLKKSVRLETFSEKANQNYFEFYLRKNMNDSTWYEIQTMPALGVARKITKESPWDRNSVIWKQYQKRGYTFVGFYLTKNIKLNTFSFFQICDRIKNLKNYPDSRLNKIHPDRDLITIFFKK